MIRAIALWIILICPAAFASAAAAVTHPTKVTLVSPGDEQHHFWKMLVEFSKQAAPNLNIELEILHGNNSPEESTRLTLEALSRTTPPDYLIFNYFFEHGQTVLKTAEKAGVHSVIINTDVPAQHSASVGTPQERYTHWLGRIIPDDERAAYDLTKYAQQSLQRKHQTNVINILAFNGAPNASASIDRSAGLAMAAAAFPELRVQHAMDAHWRADIAAQHAPELFKEYPATHLIWGSSDLMALAALNSIQQMPKSENVAGVGFDWSTNGLAAIANGSLLASAGGQFMDGALALVLIYDHVNGFRGNPSDTDIKRAMGIVHSNNVALYQDVLDPANWSEIDFRPLTHTHGRHNGQYPFGTQAVMRALFKDHAVRN